MSGSQTQMMLQNAANLTKLQITATQHIQHKCYRV